MVKLCLAQVCAQYHKYMLIEIALNAWLRNLQELQF